MNLLEASAALVSEPAKQAQSGQPLIKHTSILPILNGAVIWLVSNLA
jgi:hypothetical protein